MYMLNVGSHDAAHMMEIEKNVNITAELFASFFLCFSMLYNKTIAFDMM